MVTRQRIAAPAEVSRRSAFHQGGVDLCKAHDGGHNRAPLAASTNGTERASPKIVQQQHTCACSASKSP